MPLLAVYGTLKRGYLNHEFYLKNAKFVGKGVTINKYVLVVRVIPFCVPSHIYPNGEGLASRIVVEVYEVDEKLLGIIDKLEGHPHWYVRKLIKIELETGEVVEAWFYEYPEKVEGKIIIGKNGVAEY